MQGINLLQIYWIAADNMKKKILHQKYVLYVFFHVESSEAKLTCASCTEEK